MFLALSALLPPRGVGLDLCAFHRTTRLPCPGCGLTRSITSLTHGRIELALGYHPFGPVIYLILVLLTIYAFLPAALRQRFTDAAKRNDPAIRPAYRLFVACFMAFGVLRLGLAAAFGGGPL